MQRREFTATEQAEIIAAYKAGTSSDRLRRDYQTGWTQVSNLLREHGAYEGRRRAHHVARELEFCERYRAGESLNQIAASAGCSAAIVLKALRRHDVPRRPPGQPAPDYLPRIRELREAGLGARKIANEVGVGVTTVQKWLARWGMAGPRGKVGEEHANWTGGTGNIGGYRFVWLPATDPLSEMAWKRGYVPEHRLVMARSLGRPLTRRETVHHINGDKTDNRLENLQLRNGQHGKGVVLTCLDCGSHNVGPTPI
jgi:HNH endonuclease